MMLLTITKELKSNSNNMYLESLESPNDLLRNILRFKYSADGWTGAWGSKRLAVTWYSPTKLIEIFAAKNCYLLDQSNNFAWHDTFQKFQVARERVNLRRGIKNCCLKFAHSRQITLNYSLMKLWQDTICCHAVFIRPVTADLLLKNSFAVKVQSLKREQSRLISVRFSKSEVLKLIFHKNHVNNFNVFN